MICSYDPIKRAEQYIEELKRQKQEKALLNNEVAVGFSKYGQYRNLYVSPENLVYVYSPKSEDFSFQKMKLSAPDWIKQLIDKRQIFRLSEDPDKDVIYAMTSDNVMVKLDNDSLIVLDCNKVKVLKDEDFRNRYIKVSTFFYD